MAKQKDKQVSHPIYLVGGSKGGVGKSIVTMALIDYLKNQGKSVLLVETDTSNPDVLLCYEQEVESVTLDLDTPDGWIDLVNFCNENPESVVAINSAARNNKGVGRHGETLHGSLAELKRHLVTLWVINRQRDSLELLKEFMEAIENAAIHVVRNSYWGDAKKFEMYNSSELRKRIEERGGKTLDFPDLADRVADDLFINRLSIAKAATDLPLGNRAELLRWRKECKKMFDEVAHE